MQSEPVPDSPRDGIVTDDLRCSRCGYNLRGLGRSGKCPECGMEVALARAHPDKRDPNWRVARGIGQLYWLGFLILPIQLWIDDTLLRLAAAMGNLFCAFWITTPKEGEAAEDPQAWQLRAGRLAACGIALLALYKTYSRLQRWIDLPTFLKDSSENALNYSWAAAIAACVIVAMMRLRQVAGRVGFNPAGGWLVPFAWASAVGLLSHTMLSLDQVPDGWQQAARIARSAIALVQALVWSCILLLSGRLQQHIRDFVSSRAQSTAALRAGIRALPQHRFGWAIALTALLLTLFGGTSLPYSSYVAMIGYAIGVWLLASALSPVLQKQFAWLHVIYASDVALIIGTCAHFVLSFFLRITPTTASHWQDPTGLTISLLLSLALAASAWTAVAALAHAAAEFGHADLARDLGRRKWALAAALSSGTVLKFVLISRPLWFNAYYFAYGISVLIVLESLLVLGRTWQAIEPRVSPAAQDQPA